MFQILKLQDVTFGSLFYTLCCGYVWRSMCWEWSKKIMKDSIKVYVDLTEKKHSLLKLASNLVEDVHGILFCYADINCQNFDKSSLTKTFISPHKCFPPVTPEYPLTNISNSQFSLCLLCQTGIWAANKRKNPTFANI